MEKLRESKCYSGVARAGEWTQMQTQNGGTGSDVKRKLYLPIRTLTIRLAL